MGRPRKTFDIMKARRNEPHRANPTNPATANCAFWLSPEQLAEAHQRHTVAGRRLVDEITCPCGNHNRRMYE